MKIAQRVFDMYVKLILIHFQCIINGQIICTVHKFDIACRSGQYYVLEIYGSKIFKVANTKQVCSIYVYIDASSCDAYWKYPRNLKILKFLLKLNHLAICNVQS